MPRQEKPLNPADGPLPAFACELRELRAAAGFTYRQIAKAGHYTHPVFVKAAGGEVLPRWEVVKEFVTVCGATAKQVIRWQQRWHEIKDALDAITPSTVTVSATTAPDPAPSAGPRRSPRAGGPVARDGQRQGQLELYVPDPQQFRTPADFAMALRRLKASAGDPSFARMAVRAHVPRSTMADQCNPARRRFDWGTVGLFLDACRVPLDDHRAWGDAFWNVLDHTVDRERAARRGPIPRVDLTEVHSPTELAEALNTLRTMAGVSYSEIIFRARLHPAHWWRLGRSALAAKLQNAIRDNILLDRGTVRSFVHFCHCSESSCDPHDHHAEVQRWLAVYDHLLHAEPSTDPVNIPPPRRSRLIVAAASAALLLLLLAMYYLLV